jgi:hypothetical protein
MRCFDCLQTPISDPSSTSTFLTRYRSPTAPAMCKSILSTLLLHLPVSPTPQHSSGSQQSMNGAIHRLLFGKNTWYGLE